MDASENRPGVAVGARIRRLRAERGLSLSALATAAGIGKGSLSELESGQRNPTLQTLYAVAGPLGVPLVALLDDRPGASVSDEALHAVLLHVHRDDTGTSEVYLIRMPPDAVRRSPAHAPGVREQLVVLQGAVRIEHGTGAPEVLEVPTGGHAAWPADRPHAYTATSPEGLVAVNGILTPRPAG